MSKKKIAVIGAGIIGLNTAYYLQKTDCQVTLFDRQDRHQGVNFSKWFQINT